MKKYIYSVIDKYFQEIPPERLNKRVPKRYYKLFATIIFLLFLFIVLLFLLTQLILITDDKIIPR